MKNWRNIDKHLAKWSYTTTESSKAVQTPNVDVHSVWRNYIDLPRCLNINKEIIIYWSMKKQQVIPTRKPNFQKPVAVKWYMIRNQNFSKHKKYQINTKIYIERETKTNSWIHHHLHFHFSILKSKMMNHLLHCKINYSDDLWVWGWKKLFYFFRFCHIVCF